MLRVGQLLIIVSTSEATTMSGRRWKEMVANSAKDTLSISKPLVVLGAPSNSYAHYVSTEEEATKRTTNPTRWMICILLGAEIALATENELNVITRIFLLSLEG